LKNAQNIIKQNNFEQFIETRKSNNEIILNIIKENEKFTFCMCNPPYFSSTEEKIRLPSRDCIAKDKELATEGGEEQFISRMIEESFECRSQFKIFTTLIGRKKSIQTIKAQLESLDANLKEKEKVKVRIHETTFYQGKTIRWGVAWEFLDSL